jgi:hypothetical protein
MNENFNKSVKKQEKQKKDVPVPEFYFKFDKFNGKFVREFPKPSGGGAFNNDDVLKDRFYLNMMQAKLFSK